LPDPLDAAFAALGNDYALTPLAQELETYPYAGALSSMRALVDAHPPDYWESSLYTLWLGSLRALSPSMPEANPALDTLPAVARTEPWQKRLLNTQLGSWAQLRHDTLLYAKQSYTVGTVCEFPDAYVEPYPEFYGAVARYAEQGQTLLSRIEWPPAAQATVERVASYFQGLNQVMQTLTRMAENQRTGAEHAAADLEFINQAVRIAGGGSGPPSLEGWYNQLFYEPWTGMEYDPTIADVHTDIGGDSPPRDASVLHVGTAEPRAMVVTIDSCTGPRAYAGIVYAYHKHLAPGLTRLTDSEWSEHIEAEPPADPSWLTSVVAD
jgi:hypothetical protein